jgi:hypothetical protein
MYPLKYYLLLISVFVCFPVNAHAQSAPEIVADALYVDQDNPNASDSNDGRYSAMGGSGPFMTIQAMVDALKPGMTGYVRQSSKPYFQDYRASGAAFGGITFTSGGEDGARIVVAGYPGERPIIDQQLGISTDESKPLSGFYIHRGDYITIKNFEIVRTRTSGIFTNPGRASSDHIKHLIVDDVHIHHLYGRDNVGGIRIDGCESCIVRNSTIHDIYDTRSSSNKLNSEPYGLHAGIHGYGPRGSIIEKNTFFNLKRAIYQKHPNAFGDKSNVVRQNLFRDVSVAYALEVAGYNAPPAYGAEFYGNIVVNSGTAVKALLHETSSQSKGLKIYNNTLFNTKTLSYIRGITGVEVFNNIIVNSDDYPIYSERTGAEELGNSTQYSYVNNNLYYNVSNIAMIDRSGSYYYFRNLSDWQGALTVANAKHLSENPGSKSLVQDPLFVDSSAGNFHTKNSAILTAGRGGSYSKKLGAFGIFDDIGAGAKSSAEVVKPAAPKPPMLKIE